LNSNGTSLRRAWRFFAIWGALALCVFLLAGYLTYLITYVEKGSDRLWRGEDVGIFSKDSPGEKPTTVRFQYSERKQQSTLFLVPGLASARIVLNGIARPDVCVEITRGLRWVEKPLKLTSDPDGDVYLIDWRRTKVEALRPFVDHFVV
jgi:hypothetical protein